MLCHALGVSAINIFIHQFGILDTFAPTIFHCFNNSSNIFDLSKYHTTFTNDSLIEICQSNCQPHLRFCAENEDPGQYFFNYTGSLAYSFIICSMISSLALQYFGNYYNMYHWSKVLFCNHPILHISMIKDFLKSSLSLSSKKHSDLKSLLERGLDQEEKMFIKEATNDLAEDDHIFALAIWNDCPDIAEKIIKINIEYNIQENSKTTFVTKLKQSFPVIQTLSSNKIAWREIINDLESSTWSAKEQGLKVWLEQPMFKCIKNGQFGLACLFHCLGASCGIRDEHDTTVLKSLCEIMNKTADFWDNNRFLIWYMKKYFIDSKGKNLLHALIETKSCIFLKRLYKIGDDDLEFRTRDDGKTPLMAACEKGNVEIVQFLIDCTTNIHEKDVAGWTPLHSAASEGHLEIVQLLLEKGANIDEKNVHGWTLLRFRFIFSFLFFVLFIFYLLMKLRLFD